MDENVDLPIEDDILQNFDYYFANHVTYFPTPEKNLMMSVLLYGVMDFLSNRKNADEWFHDEDDHFYSLKHICLTLEIESSKFKKRILDLKSKSKKIKNAKHLNSPSGAQKQL